LRSTGVGECGLDAIKELIDLVCIEFGVLAMSKLDCGVDEGRAPPTFPRPRGAFQL
jgi:hypothetical protein